MIVMGVDPGSRVTGWGVISLEGNRVQCVDFGAVRTIRGGRQTPPIADRLKTIYEEIDAVLVKHRPEVVAVEGVFYAVNIKSALTLGHVRGVILFAAAFRSIPIVEFSPLEVKKAVVGVGRADKGQVQMMVQRLLNLRQLPEPHDASDALALALCQAFNGSQEKRRQRRWRSYEVQK
ncbi:MAG: crossover junction endodeoxyribonuclease RuvC [Acidobacteriota bacterium]|nr:MAG: crossover junction endodeoxyribonuclease RuvC [Acidobacteriota bacterium]